VTRYPLDTNIIGNVTKPKPSEPLVAWLEAQVDQDLSSQLSGLPKFGEACSKSRLGKNATSWSIGSLGPEGPRSLFAGRILDFDQDAALVWARLMAEGTALGRPRSALDMMVAATAEVNDCVVVTDKEKHFRSVVQMINPLKEGR
jgi:toxin FitB